MFLWHLKSQKEKGKMEIDVIIVILDMVLMLVNYCYFQVYCWKVVAVAGVNLESYFVTY